MRKVMLLLLAFASQGLAAISSVTLPNEDINGVDTPQVVWVDQNFDTLKVRQNQVIDTLNSYVPGGGALQSLILKSNTNLNLRIDADNNASGNNLAITHNGAVDTLLKIGDDSTTKVFGGFTVNGAVTHASLSGTGTRMVTATSAGVLGNATTIAGANTWSDGQVFSSTATHGNDVVFSSDRTIRRDVGTGYLVLAGGSSSSDGANLLMIGGSHATAAGDWTFRSNSTDRLGWDESATQLSLTGKLNVSSTLTADSLISSKFYTESSFTGTLGGCSSGGTGTIYYTRIGKAVTLLIPQITCTSNSTSGVISGVPAAITPAREVRLSGLYSIIDNSVTTAATAVASAISYEAYLTASSTIQLIQNGGTAFTASGTKGIAGGYSASAFMPFTYTLQ